VVVTHGCLQRNDGIKKRIACKTNESGNSVRADIFSDMLVFFLLLLIRRREQGIPFTSKRK
jgi:hypothetical protein